MRWSTELINLYESDPKSFLRDSKISEILGIGDIFTNPFYDFFFRNSNIDFELTEIENTQINNIKENIEYFYNFLPFTIKDFQKDMVNNIYTNRFNAFVVARQIGTTTISMSELMYYIITNKNKKIVIFSTEKITLTSNFEMFKKVYLHLPYFLKTGIVNMDINGILFDNGIKVSFVVDELKLRGKHIDYLILPDYCFSKTDVSHLFSNADKILVYSIAINGNFSRLYFSNNLFFKKKYTYHNNTKKFEYLESSIRLIGIKSAIVEHECEFENTEGFNKKLIEIGRELKLSTILNQS